MRLSKLNFEWRRYGKVRVIYRYYCDVLQDMVAHCRECRRSRRDAPSFHPARDSASHSEASSSVLFRSPPRSIRLSSIRREQ
jgi:hypothetical protein